MGIEPTHKIDDLLNDFDYKEVHVLVVLLASLDPYEKHEVDDDHPTGQRFDPFQMRTITKVQEWVKRHQIEVLDPPYGKPESIW